MTMTEAQENGYVECGECGHPLESHVGECLTDCDCPEQWTEAEVRKVRVREGLPADWRYS